MNLVLHLATRLSSPARDRGPGGHNPIRAPETGIDVLVIAIYFALWSSSAFICAAPPIPAKSFLWPGGK